MTSEDFVAERLLSTIIASEKMKYILCVYMLKFLLFSTFRGDSLYKMIKGFFFRINQSNRYFRIRLCLITFKF